MACPFFHPSARLADDGWVIPPRLPLGAAYTGECRAGAAAFQPDESQLRRMCNVGYGRGACEHFPTDASADAVRFHVTGDARELIRIQYIVERDCWPAENGAMECALPGRDLRGSGNPILRAQALAFVEMYLERKQQHLASNA